MLKKLMAALALAGALTVAAQTEARAQQQAYFIQVEAESSLTGARETARSYGDVFDNAASFALGGGWYGIALGPYTQDEAERVLANLQGRGQIPPDSYVQDAGRYDEQVWPPGADRASTMARLDASGSSSSEDALAQALGAAQDGAQDAQDTQQQAARDTAPEPETPEQARASERELTRAEREQLQIALQWAGHYGGRIDAAFGPNTRNAMRSWQQANGYETTGILTTAQRAQVLEQYNSVFDGLGFARHVDDRAGIAMEIPLGVVAFDGYEPPFAKFEPTTDLGARVLLISRPGDRQTLGGLYEIMQTLEIVPLEGERNRSNDGFVLKGANDAIVSHTEVGLADGALKGFTLIWPAGDEARRTRVLARMQESFERRPGVLEAPAALADDPAVDLVAGLRVRQPVRSTSGFFVDRAGRVLTSAAGVQGCARVTLDSEHEAQVVAQDAELGLAVLRPEDALAPRRVAQFRADPPRLRSEVAVAGYSFGGVLGAPTLTFGTLEEMQGLRGEDALKRLTLASQPGDAGGPVLDDAGAVLGMLLPRDDQDNRRLPQDVSFAAKTDEIMAFLRGAGIDARAGGAGGALDPVDLTRVGAEMTVLVSCWD
ncbi:trypsin-like peptidase domain-containing protein [Citreimonas salinaria]|uniref:Sporulation related domain-containing protein n=1 Tax=Citreimonas salinaria TaxID=321339 RepID=A0A1H3K0M4_9RHOB|nr:trypsin-like peptidase domain-containing protein [Citreimonas salinaria]SDY45742.1 Sporulation related domain-containing protein [Citreimonas salinaria]